MTAMWLKRYPSPSGGIALGKMGVGATLLRQGKTARDYVQDGLVAMWDGIENAGWGVHDPNATTWKDLVGNFDLTLGVASSWEKSALYVASNVSKGAAFRDEVYDQTKVQTIEACFQVDYGSDMAWIVCINGDVVRGGTTLCMIARYASSEGIMRNAVKSTPWQRNYKANTISVMADTGYVNAADLGSRTYNNNFVNPGCFCLFGRNGSTTYQPSKGRIYRCAIYSRALTADEIAANYAIDRERFNLP